MPWRRAPEVRALGPNAVASPITDETGARTEPGSPQEPLRVLSIDGGGIRGLVPALVLQKIEEEAKRPVSELFDVVAGTSAGGLLALALFKDRKPMSAREVAALFHARAGEAFPSPRLRTPLFGVTSVRYDSKGLRSLVDELIGDRARLGDSRAKLLIPAIDLRSRKLKIFDSSRHGTPYKMIDVALATTAAPSYFDPHEIVLEEEGHSTRAYVDGGLAANDPAAIVVARHWQEIQRRGVVLVSLGTGRLLGDTGPLDLADRGLKDWKDELAGLTIDSSSHVTYRIIRDLLSSPPDNGLIWRQFRVNPELSRRIGLDDSSPESLKQLTDATYDWGKEGGDEIITDIIGLLDR
ncbi:MAG: patatin-like phospholipase family protein [Actinomycetes bacterium]